MSPITEIPSKPGIGLIAKVLNLFKPFQALPTSLLALALCSQPISANAKQSSSVMSQLNPQKIADLLKQQGFPQDKIPTMTAIAMAESGGRTQAFNPEGLDKSYGLFQVNMHGGLGPARMKQFGLQKESQLFDPATNAKAAKQILGSQGLGAWSVYKSGKYKEFLPQAQQAAQTAQATPQQQPQEVAAAPGGRTFILFGGMQPQVDPKENLDRFILKTIFDSNTPKIDTGFNSLALLSSAFGLNQTPQY